MAAVEDEIGGRILRIEEGKFITQAQGSVVVRYGDTLYPLRKESYLNLT